MRATCSKCGQPWGVSIHKKLKKPYICPKCTKLKRIAVMVAGFIVSCLIVPKLNVIANEQRGYQALGGEVLIPLLYLLLVVLIKTIGGMINEKS